MLGAFTIAGTDHRYMMLHGYWWIWMDMLAGQNLVPRWTSKIVGKWMFIPKIRRTLWALTHPHSKKTYYHNPTLSPLLLVILWMVAKSCATKRMVKSPEIRGYINHLWSGAGFFKSTVFHSIWSCRRSKLPHSKQRCTCRPCQEETQRMFVNK